MARKFLIFWTLFIGIGALLGSVMMWTDPSGVMWGLDPLLPMLREKMPWHDVFFNDFIPSGFALLAVNGITQFSATLLLFKRHGKAPWAVAACGVTLILWIVLEWWIFGFNFLSNIYFAFGVIEIAVAGWYGYKERVIQETDFG